MPPRPLSLSDDDFNVVVEFRPRVFIQSKISSTLLRSRLAELVADSPHVSPRSRAILVDGEMLLYPDVRKRALRPTDVVAAKQVRTGAPASIPSSWHGPSSADGPSPSRSNGEGIIAAAPTRAAGRLSGRTDPNSSAPRSSQPHHGRPDRGADAVARRRPTPALPPPPKGPVYKHLDLPSAACTIATASRWLCEPHRRWNRLPLKPRMEFLRPIRSLASSPLTKSCFSRGGLSAAEFG